MHEENAEANTAMRLLRLVTASWMSTAMSAAAEIGVADHLADGPLPVNDIATAVGADPRTLYRLLRACADIGLFQETDGQVFALTDLGDGLRSDSPNSIRSFVRWVGLAADRHTWSDLAQTVRTGEPAFARVHGKEVWEYFRDLPDVAEVFDNAMTELSNHVIKPVVGAYDFSRFRRIVDVGGGHGSLLATILAANPAATGVLFDQPEVIAGAGSPFDEAGVRARCEVVDGDFFVSVPAGGDAYVLSNIIHDWDDEPARQILANCRGAMAENGRVLLVEAVIPDGVESSLTVKLMDLDMLVISGGRQRSGAQFDALFQEVGLKLARIVPAGLCSVVEAVRA